VPVKPETIFQSGSVGKQFTAFAIMLLVDEGKVGLDEKIGKYLGEVPDAWANVTVRHLLSHTGGMTDYPQGFDFRRDYTEDEVLQKVKEVPFAFKPGEKWQYSNLGYVTLGILIGKVTGKFYGDFLQERVFKPLGMTTARIINEADIIPNRAAGYRLVRGELKNQNWVSPSINTTADGSLYLSALDMVKWDDALSNGKLLSKSSYGQMWTPVRVADGKEQFYGFGWGLSRLNGKRVIAHSGAWQGFRSIIARYPENRLTVIVFANSSNANPDSLTSRIAAMLDPSLKPIPITDPDPKLSADNRALFEKILAGTVEENRFTSSVVTALKDPNDRLLGHLKTIGAIRKFELLDTREVGENKGWQYAVEFDSMSVVLEIVRNKQGTVIHFVVQPQ
jgi:CubicO group peptidase (beta-lactamase class C family)